MRKPFLSVVIPSYNELKNLKRGVLDSVLEYLESQSYPWEIILTDDGSADGTTEALHAFAKRSNHITVVENIHAGKAPTVTSGMLAASGQWRLFTDFDQSTPISEVEKLLPFIEQGFSVIIGSREMVGAVRDEEPWYRRLMGRGFNLVVQIFAVPGILDTQCGFKLFSEEATTTLFNTLYIYGSKKERKDAYTGAFDVELLYLATKMGFNVKEVPITWFHNETERVSPIKDSLRMFIDILRMRFARIQGKYQL